MAWLDCGLMLRRQEGLELARVGRSQFPAIRPWRWEEVVDQEVHRHGYMTCMKYYEMYIYILLYIIYTVYIEIVWNSMKLWNSEIIARQLEITYSGGFSGKIIEDLPARHGKEAPAVAAFGSFPASLNLGAFSAARKRKGWWNPVKCVLFLGRYHRNIIDTIPSGNLSSYWKWPFIVDFPIKNGDFP